MYGFHGTSHKYVTTQAGLYLNQKETKLISIHLGNGCSMAAVINGKCMDTSMGFSPLAGLIMGTRSGDIDASVVFYLIDKGYSSADINTLLNKQSGMLGVAGYNDMRDVNKALEQADANAKLALEMYAFTAGVGENDVAMRKRVCTNLSFLNITVDDEKNEENRSDIREINTTDALLKVLVVPTNEELEIARQCFELLQS